MIAISGLDFAYLQSDFRLQIPKLAIDKGTKAAFIGPSGSGKTTLLSLIAGIALPSSGRIVTNGVEVSSLGDAARRRFRIRHVGLVFQEFELLDHLNVLDNILLACRIHCALPLNRPMRERAESLAAEVGLDDKLGRCVRRLSQGERQRVAVCRALLPRPPLLLCDEPTGNLDPANKEHVLDVLVDYVEKANATLVTVTHDREILPRFDTVVDFKRLHGYGKETS
ncbi:MAG: ATP-binding cassette domain-containing protein [Planctomycetota bacterium]